MKLGAFIEMLKKYPEDTEVFLGNENCNKHIFQTIYTEGGSLLIASNPGYIGGIVKGEHNQFNVDDTFTFYDEKTGDIIKGTYDEYNVIYENNLQDDASYFKSNEYYSEDFQTTTGLIQILKAFPDTPVNIRITDGFCGVIHKVTKEKVGYLVGNYDDVDEEYYDEIFLEVELPISPYDGGGSFSLKDCTPEWWTGEIESVIVEPIKRYFTQNGKLSLTETMTSDELRNWNIIVTEIRKELQKYYRFHYTINASHDSNGYYHLRDKNNPYNKPAKKKAGMMNIW